MARKYEQRLRATAAAQTRRRVLDAVYEQVRTAPTEPVSLDRVATAAEVSRSTIYLLFGSRGGLFEALATDLLHRGGFERILQAATHPDGREALRGVIGSCVTMYAAHLEVLRALASMAVLDTEAVGGTIETMEEGRAIGMARLAGRLAEQGVLRQDITVDHAADLLWLLTSFHSVDLLHTSRDLPMDQVARILIDTAERSLCR